MEPKHDNEQVNPWDYYQEYLKQPFVPREVDELERIFALESPSEEDNRERHLPPAA